MEVFQDPDYHTRLESMVSDILTAIRSSIKQKVCHVPFEVSVLLRAVEQIDQSFREAGGVLCIGLLAQKLLPRNAVITMDHWARFAFLVCKLIFPAFMF
jgi:hypothetical protein